MLNDKEEQTIFKLREIIDFDKQHRIETIYDNEQIEFRNNIELMLNLVEKLQKENGELKEKKLIDRAMIEDSISKGIVERDYIPKDKIRELFKKYNINISEEEITVDGIDALTFISEIDELLEEE